MQGLEHLLELANTKRCVTLGGSEFQGMFGKNYQPAAWVANMSASVVHKMLPYLYVYKPKGKGKGKANAQASEET